MEIDNRLLEKVSELLESGDMDRLLVEAAHEIRALLRPAIDRISTRLDGAQFPNRDLLNRCMARRQQEAFDGILSLVADGREYLATVMLRPMCEDLIFLGWINGLDQRDADEYLVVRAKEEITRGLAAQEAFFPRLREMLHLGGAPEDTVRIQRLDAELQELKEALRGIGRRAGWGDRPGPTVKAMAEASDRMDLYDFLYRASSASVHASPHHIYRMVWGNPNDGFTITTSHMAQYNRRFALIYGSYLYAEHVGALESIFTSELGKIDDALGVWLALLLAPTAEQSAPPIVTKQELAWNW
jgi:hypothetical protein